jgi:hypothetical protein
MPAPLLVGPALYGAGLISGGLKTAAGVLGVGGTYAALRGAGVNPLGGRAESMAERRGLTPPPARGDRRSDGRFYTGPEHGWQSAPTARKHGLLGSEVLGDAAFPERPAPPRRNVQWQDVMFGNSVPAGANSTGAANPGQWSPTAQQNPRLPAGRNVAIVNPPQRAQNRALNIAAQNAGLPAWNWQADENSAMLESAQARGTAAAAAREAQGGRGYITADSMPASLDQSKADYWQGADMAAWAAANPELARRAQERAGFTPAAVSNSTGVAGIGPVSDGEVYGQQLQAMQGTSGMGPLADAGTYGSMLTSAGASGVSPLGNPPPPRSAGVVGIGPVSDGEVYGQQLQAMQGTSGMGPLADAETYGRMLTPAEEQRRRAGELTDAYLRAIKGGIQGMGR